METKSNVFKVSCFSSGSLKFYDRHYDLKHVIQHISGHDLFISKLSEIIVVGV